MKNWRYERDEHLRRVTLRLAKHVREYYEEIGYSHSRFFDSMFIPDDLVSVGISEAAKLYPDRKRRREHVVPLKVIMDYVLDMIELKKDDTEIAGFIAHHTKIVILTIEEAARIDVGSGKQNMPTGWVPYHDIYDRLNKARIPWQRYDGGPINEEIPSTLQAEGRELHEACHPVRVFRHRRNLDEKRARLRLEADDQTGSA